MTYPYSTFVEFAAFLQSQVREKSSPSGIILAIYVDSDKLHAIFNLQSEFMLHPMQDGRLVDIVPKKVELSIRFFEPFWISRVFHFSLGTFAKVEDLPDPLETSDKTYALSKFDISRSNETIQNALASIV